MPDAEELEWLLESRTWIVFKGEIIVEDHCVVCGAIIPEGGMVCPTCRERWLGPNNSKEEKNQNESKLESSVQE